MAHNMGRRKLEVANVAEVIGWAAIQLLPSFAAGAAAIITNPAAQVLVQQRDCKPGIPFPGHWTLPGGRIEQGETPAQAINREVWEEIEVKMAFALWKKYKRAALYRRPAIIVTQYIFSGQTDVPLDAMARNEGQILTFFDPSQIADLPIGFGFAGVIRQYFER